MKKKEGLFHFVLYLLLELERQQVNKDKVDNVSDKYKVFIGNTFRSFDRTGSEHELKKLS
jgi:hypothetical protein